MLRTPNSIMRLIEDLQSTDEFTRAQAAFALGMLGEPAVEPLIKLLSSDDYTIRKRSAWALSVIGQPALRALLALAEDGNPALRIEAIRILGVIGEARVLNQLIHALTDPNPRIAQRAATALGKNGDPRGFHPLLMALHHPSPDVQYAACGALANLHIAEAIIALEELSYENMKTTSWGASVADAARRAIQEIQVALPSDADHETDFSRLSALLEKHQSEQNNGEGVR